MREIRFRGKRLDNGEWVYGYYLRGASDFIAVDDGILEGHWSIHKVDPSSVGQYTGLKDKNGQPIYEGDILATDSEFIDGIVEWMNDRGCYYLTDPEGYAADSDYCYDGMEWHKLEVIGNIHDNPELLQGGEPRG